MPAVETSSLKQRAVLYAQSSYNKFGEQSVSAGTEIKARWELGTLNIDGTEESGGTVWVNQIIAIGSLMYEGGLADIPDPVTDLYEVIDFTRVPDIKGRKVELRCTVRKFGDSLPTIDA